MKKRINIGLGIMAVLVLMPILAGGTETVTDPSLVAYWNFDSGKMEDLQGKEYQGYRIIDNTNYSNNGETHGCKSVTGVIGKGLEFNGLSDYADFPVPRPASLSFKDRMTVMLWVKRRSLDDSQLIIGDGAYFDGWRIGTIKGFADRIFVEFGATPPTKEGGKIYLDSGGTGESLTGFKWIHVALTFDKDSPDRNINIYVNGKLAAGQNKKDDINLTAGKNPLSLAKKAGGIYWFKGVLDELKLYNRALSADEIKAEYRRGEAGARSSPAERIPVLVDGIPYDTGKYGKNLLLNGGFEDENKTGLPLFWNWKWEADEKEYDKDGIQAHTGKKCITTWHNNSASQKVALTGGKRYYLSAWVKSKNVAACEARVDISTGFPLLKPEAEIGTRCCYAAWYPKGQENCRIVVTTRADNKEWKQMECSFVPEKSGDITISVMGELDPSKRIWSDDVELLPEEEECI